MLNTSIILFRYYKQFASKIYNAISMYYFLCKLITDLQNSIHFITGLLLYKLKLTAGAALKRVPCSYLDYLIQRAFLST